MSCNRFLCKAPIVHKALCESAFYAERVLPLRNLPMKWVDSPHQLLIKNIPDRCKINHVRIIHDRSIYGISDLCKLRRAENEMTQMGLKYIQI